MAFVLGLNAKTYQNTGTYGSPTWTLRGNVRDVTINLELATADVTTRGGGGYRQVLGTLAEGSIDFEMIYDTEDALFIALKDAFENRTLIDMAFADGVLPNPGAGNTTTYFRAEFSVTNFTVNQPLEEAMTVSVSLSSGFSSNAPGFFDAVGSA